MKFFEDFEKLFQFLLFTWWKIEKNWWNQELWAQIIFFKNLRYMNNTLSVLMNTY